MVIARRDKQKLFLALLSRHAAALGYVVRSVAPVILRTGRRPVIFSRGSGMGDIICTISVVRELKKRHPGKPSSTIAMRILPPCLSLRELPTG